MIRAPALAVALVAACHATHGGAPADAIGDVAIDAPAPADHHLPHLVHHGGPTLATMRLVTIVASNDGDGAALAAYGDRLVASAWWQTARSVYSLGAATSAHVVGPQLTTDVTQPQMIAYIQQAIGTGPLAPDGNTLYVLYLPAGVHNVGSVPFDAYHAPFPSPAQSRGDAFAVVEKQTPFGGGETALGATERIGSHEIVEAATDPLWTAWSLDAPPHDVATGTPWQVVQVPGPIENGDLCEGTRWFEGSDEYQRFWSNTAVDAGGDPCVPARAAPFGATFPARDWTPAGASTTTAIAITGWAPAATADWFVLADVRYATGGLASLVGKLVPLTSPLGAEDAPCRGQGMNVGVDAALALAVPAGAARGDYAVVEIESFRVDASTCFPPTDGDQFEYALAGIYVP
jgi:hypothetical protein